ncbi:Tetratricopeptide repeat 14, partial [Paramuricea clavata]
MGDTEDTIRRIDRFVQSINVLGLDVAEATAQEQGCDPGSDFVFLDLQNHTSYATHYYRQKLESCIDMTDVEDPQFRNKIKHFVASKADLIFKLKGKEKLRSGIDYNIDGAQEAYSVFATQVLPIENGMQLSSVARRAHIFEVLKVGDIILGKVVGKRPFGVFVRILSLVHGRNLDFNNIDIQALCPKSELEKDHKSREHLDPIDDFDVDDIVQGVICSISKDEERIAISFRSAKLPSEYGNIEL